MVSTFTTDLGHHGKHIPIFFGLPTKSNTICVTFDLEILSIFSHSSGSLYPTSTRSSKHATSISKAPTSKRLDCWSNQRLSCNRHNDAVSKCLEQSLRTNSRT